MCPRVYLLVNKCKQNHLATVTKLTISWFYQIEHEIRKLKKLVLSFYDFSRIIYEFWKINKQKIAVNRRNWFTTPV